MKDSTEIVQSQTNQTSLACAFPLQKKLSQRQRAWRHPEVLEREGRCREVLNIHLAPEKGLANCCWVPKKTKRTLVHLLKKINLEVTEVTSHWPTFMFTCECAEVLHGRNNRFFSCGFSSHLGHYVPWINKRFKVRNNFSSLVSDFLQNTMKIKSFYLLKNFNHNVWGNITAAFTWWSWGQHFVERPLNLKPFCCRFCHYRNSLSKHVLSFTMCSINTCS